MVNPTVVVRHGVVTGAPANPAALVDGPAWDAAHSVTVSGLENVPNVDTTNASNLTSGTVPAARLPEDSRIFATRATATSTAIPAVVTGIIVRRYTSSDIISDAPYARGTGSQSFTDALGATWSLDLSGSVVKSRWFNCKGDNATDDTANLNLAAAAAAGKTLLIEGLCGVSANIACPSSIVVTGNNSAVDGISALGTNLFARGLLYFNNKTQIKIRNLTFLGNLTEPPAFSIGAIDFDLDQNGAAADMADIEISGNYFANFKHSAWIGGLVAAQSGATSKIRNVRIFNNFVNAPAASATTNAQSGTTGSFFCYFRGNILYDGVDKESTENGTVSGVTFHNNTGLFFGLDGVFGAQYNVRDIVITNNNTRYVGHNTLAANLAYTYMVYNSSTTTADPQDIVFSNNVSFEGKSNGGYFAGPRNVVACNNVINSVTPGSNLSLPQGCGLSFNGPSQLTCTGNVLIGNVVGISYYERFDLAGHDIIANNTIVTSISTGAINACGIRLVADPSAVAANNLTTVMVLGNNINVLGTGDAAITLQGTTQFGRIKIAGNAIKSISSGINCASTILATELSLANNSISGTLVNNAYNIVATSSPVHISNELIDFSEVVAGASGGVILDGCTKLTVSGLTIANKVSTGAALSMIGTQGRCKNVSFPGTTSTLVAATSAGLSKPGWTGVAFDTFQNFQNSFYTDTGGTLPEWTWSTGTTWLERRTPSDAAWPTWSPTFTTTTVGGTPITAAVIATGARFKQVGKLVNFTLDFQISNIGAGNTGLVTFTLPVTAASASLVLAGSGKEVINTAKLLAIGSSSATIGTIAMYDATSPIVLNNRFQLGGFYEAA